MSILLFQFEITMHNLQNLVKNAYVHVLVFNKFSFEFNFTWKNLLYLKYNKFRNSKLKTNVFSMSFLIIKL